MKRVMLYFGSFNPIHKGHIALAEYAVEKGLCDELVLVVSPQSPYKQAEELAPEMDRFEMAEAACAASRYPDRIKPSVVEFLLPKPSYTIDTLRYLAENHGADMEFSILMGADQIERLDGWKEYDRILEYPVYVYPRRGERVDRFPGRITVLEDAPLQDFSATQIRGRIGRSNRRAYAYLTFRVGKVLTEVAAKRLTAIREYVEFGSGFKIAMRDLEIRGAGNLLGPEQSGYMMSVGYDMYLKLLNDAVLEQQGRGAEVRTECSADLTVPAYIPEGYVPAAEQRMDLYRRIAALRTPADEADLMDELLDRYGDVPKPVTALLNVAMLRAAAMETGITDITQKGRQLIFSFDMRIEPAALLAVCGMAGYRDRLQLAAGASPKLTLFLQPKEDALDAAGGLVEQLRLQQNELQLQGQQPQEGGNEP